MEKVIIHNETIHLKKGKFGYRVVQPIKDSEGNFITVNLLVGGWGNLFKLLFILFVLGCFFYGFQQATESCRDMAEHPEKYFDLKDSSNPWALNLTWESENINEEKG